MPILSSLIVSYYGDVGWKKNGGEKSNKRPKTILHFFFEVPSQLPVLRDIINLSRCDEVFKTHNQAAKVNHEVTESYANTPKLKASIIIPFDKPDLDDRRTYL
jgi:hypothetical protein